MTTLDDIERDERIREVQTELHEYLDARGITAKLRKDGEWELVGDIFDIYETLAEVRSLVEELA